MKRHLSKALAALLALVMVVALLPATVFAADATSAEDLAKTLAPGDGGSYDSDKVEVSGNTVKLKSDITNVNDLGINIPGLILDLDQYSITLNSDCTLIFKADATITGTDKGTITQAGGTNYWTVQVTGCTVELTGGTITAAAGSKECVYVGGASGSSFKMSGGTLKHEKMCLHLQDGASATISGSAKIESTGNTVDGQQAVDVMDGSSLVMSGGKISAKGACIQAHGEDTKVSITDGEIENKDSDGYAAVYVVKKAHFEMTGGKITTDQTAVSVGTVQEDVTGTESIGTTATIGGTAEISRTKSPNVGLLDVQKYGILNIEGSAQIKDEIMVFENGELNVKGGTITSTGYAIGTNGSAEGSQDSSKGAKINISGGKVTSTGESCGVYLPAGEMTVTGGEISGAAGIVVRGGDLTVEGGTVTATAASTTQISVGDSGHAVPAAGITVDNAGYPEQAAGQKHVTISDGATIKATQVGGKSIVACEGEKAVDKGQEDKVSAEKNPFDIVGGTLTVADKPDEQNVTQFLNKGYEYKEGKIEENEEETANFAAQINGGMKYETLADALEHAVGGDIITLLNNVTLPGEDPERSNRIEISKKITIDSGGFTLSKPAKMQEATAGIKVVKGGDLTVIDTADSKGKITGNGTLIGSFEGGKITLDGCTIEQTEGTDQNNNAAVDTDGTDNGAITVKGGTVINAAESGVGAHGKATVTIEGGEINAGIYGVVTNGGANYGNTTVNITGGKITGDYAGMYLPSQGGKTTVTGDATITGTNGAGVVVRGGTIEVSEDAKGNAPTIVAGGNAEQTYGDDAAVLPPAALVVDKNDGYGENVSAAIEGGNFEAQSGEDAVVYTENGEEKPESNNGSLAVKGGTFSSAVDEEYLDSSVNAELVSENGGHSYYPSVDAAFENANPGDQLLDLKDKSEVRVCGVTIVYGNGTKNKEEKVRADDTYHFNEDDPTREGYTFTGWIDQDGNPYTKDQVIAVTKDLTITAQWKVNEPEPSAPVTPTYTTTVTKPANGSVKVSPSRTVAGNRVTLTVTPDDGYVLDTLTVTRRNTGEAVTVTKNSNGTYSFVMPKGGVSVKVTFKAGQQRPVEKFTDLDPDAWYYDYVDFMVENGLMIGMDDDKFGPNELSTRGTIMTMLARRDGVDTSASDPWWQVGLDWAVEHELSDGTAQDRNITRMELVTILYRYADKPAVDASILDSYADAADVADWARDAMAWAVANKIIEGRASGGAVILAPTGTARRVETAKMVTTFCDVTGK